jgi:hypothetical protein
VGAGSAGGGGSVGRPAPKPVWTPPSAEPKGVSNPAPVPPDAEAVGAGSAGGGGGGGNCGPLTSNPASPRPEASAPIVSASALPALASEKASAAATVLVIFKDVRAVDSDKKMSPLSVVGFGATPRGTVTRSVVGRMSPRWPSSHQGKAGADNGWCKRQVEGGVPDTGSRGKKCPSHPIPAPTTRTRLMPGGAFVPSDPQAAARPGTEHCCGCRQEAPTGHRGHAVSVSHPVRLEAVLCQLALTQLRRDPEDYRLPYA